MTTIRQALYLIGREHRARWALLVVVALVASGVEVVGAALVYVLLGLVADPSGEVSLPIVGDVRALVDVDQDTLLLGLAVVMGVFFVVRAIVHVGEIYLQNRVAHNMGARLATKLVRGYLAMPYAFHLSRTSADLIRNSHQAVKELVKNVFVPIIRVVAETIMVLAILVLLVSLAPAATGLAVFVIGGAALLMLRVIQPRLKRLGRRSHQLQRDSLETLQQSLHGIRDIKVLGRESAFVRRYERARFGLARVEYLRSTATELPKTIMELALLGFILVVFGGSVLLDGGAGGTVSVLGLFAYAGLRLQPSLQRIIAGLNNLKFSSAPIADLDRDLRQIGELSPAPPASSALPFERELRLQGVCFRYEAGHRNALTDIDLVVEPGQVLGICGPTGGGKTTLVDVITGLLEPTSGTVTVDGADLRERAREWQRNLGVVPQMVFLTDEPVRENIALGVPRNRIDDAAVNEAIDLAQLRTFVDSLPDGLDTIVGERGVRISGGQRQRVAIARALYRRPNVLIFDEGTSALDNTTEHELMSALARLRGDHTILLVAHRLSTVVNADQIAFIENGRLSGLGTYSELLTTNVSFNQLVQQTVT
jgi:ATP-binding cassette, subfamily B, bacterial PglK